MKKIIIMAAAGVLFAAMSFPVLANDASMGRMGETVYPIQADDVRMVSEDIYIKYNSADWSGDVDCTFVFHNEGAARTVLMGFPAEMEIGLESMTTVDRVRMHNFTAELNGVPIPVVETQGTDLGTEDDFSEYKSWYTFEVPFEAGQTLTLTHTYDVNFTIFSEGSANVGYILETGSTWSGSIDRSTVTFDFTEVEPWGIEPDSNLSTRDFTYSDGLLVFEGRDFEPDFNLNVMTNYVFAKSYSGPMPEWIDVGSLIEFFTGSEGRSAGEMIADYNNLGRSRFIATVYLNTLFGYPDEQSAPVVAGLSYMNPGRFEAIISDPDFDMDRTAGIVIKDAGGNAVYEGIMYKEGFADYGSEIFRIWPDEQGREAMASGNARSFEITAVDLAGNRTVEVFTLSSLQSVPLYTYPENEPEQPEEEIPNPKTSSVPDLSFLIIPLSAAGLMALRHRKSR
ncbi:MAG: hypothetical protein JXB33_03400 [Clostridia bacterium]|nr:hypothetical protein [Clostridia bacterium]